MNDLSHNADLKVTVYFCKPTDKKPGGYIAAYTTASRRKGEDWNRGNDLPDGPYSKKTLNQVIGGLKSVYEKK